MEEATGMARARWRQRCAASRRRALYAPRAAAPLRCANYRQR